MVNLKKNYGHVNVYVFNNQELQVSVVAVEKSIVAYILLKGWVNTVHIRTRLCVLF